MHSRFRKLFQKLGPGVITGASDDDPSGIATYSQAGAGFGLTMLWTMLFTVPLMITVQEMCARIAIVTGKGLIRNIRERHGRPMIAILVGLFFIANTINIGADLGAMASAGGLIFTRIPFAAWLIFFAALTLALEIFITYKTYATYLKWMTLALFSYVLVAFVIHLDWIRALVTTVVPQVSHAKEYWLMLVAILGTTISPYLYVWQANEEIEEEDARHQPKGASLSAEKMRKEIRAMRFDTMSGMIFSNVIAWFIIATAGAVLFAAGITSIDTADQAARVLAPLAGHFASLLFAIGIVGTGLLAVPILSGSGAYAVSELLGLKEGLSKKWWQAKGFYGVILVSTVIGALMNALGISPIKALIYSAVANGLIAAPILFVILKIGGDAKVMREHRNGTLARILGWLTFFVMAAASAVWLVSLL